MNILVMNWRDMDHPFSGGAERITQKYAEYWSKSGHTVYWLSSIFAGAQKSSINNGIHHIRTGPSLIGRVSYLCIATPFYFLKSIIQARSAINEYKIDVVIDEIHGIPFFTPLYSKKRNILLVCEVADSIWDKMFPFPLNKLGKILERRIYKIYKNTEIWAISQNTANDISKFLPNVMVKILPLGIDAPAKTLFKKNKHLTLVFLARIVKMKGVEIALKMVSELKKQFPEVVLNILGKGSAEYVEQLKEIAKNLHIENNINFVGKVSEEDKYKYLGECHFLIHPSFKEGFGLTVLEAACVGTPSIVRTGGSLQELVIPTKTGILFTDEDTAPELPDINSNKYLAMSMLSKKHSAKYLWPKILTSSKKITNL